MVLIDAVAWGVLGGTAAALVSVSGDVVSAGFKWPWRGNETFWPRMFVAGVGVILGGLVSGAAHGQMSGIWPAFIMGAGAPSVVRSMLFKVAVAEAKKMAGVREEAEDDEGLWLPLSGSPEGPPVGDHYYFFLVGAVPSCRWRAASSG